MLMFCTSSFSQNIFSSVTILCDKDYVSFFLTETENYQKKLIEDNFGRDIDTFLVVDQTIKLNSISTNKIVVDPKLIKYLKSLNKQLLRYSCTSSNLDYPGIFEINPKVIDYTIFQVIFFQRNNYCNIIRYTKSDLKMYLKHDFRFIIIQNTVNKIKKHSLK